MGGKGLSRGTPRKKSKGHCLREFRALVKEYWVQKIKIGGEIKVRGSKSESGDKRKKRTDYWVQLPQGVAMEGKGLGGLGKKIKSNMETCL